MWYYCILITLTWFGSASLQYINTGGPREDMVLEPLEPNIDDPLPYLNVNNFFNVPQSNDFETYQNTAGEAQHDNYAKVLDQEIYDQKQIQNENMQRKRRTVENTTPSGSLNLQWRPNLIDTDQTMYLKNGDTYNIRKPFIMHGFTRSLTPNSSDIIFNAMNKKSFSPWGGKRGRTPILEHMWTWKRAANIREPSMPKRVRFSPWGGKRSGQLIYKPAGKTSKVIFSSSYIPEIARLLSRYQSNDNNINLAGIQFIPLLHNRHPFRVLALSAKLGDRVIREALPFKSEMDDLPKFYKPGHPYVDISLKKDGKRKVKFSAWGGKRAPPIIGPIWTPSSQTIKDSTLNAILLIRNTSESSEMTKAA